ncbi:MAG TPA: hypothetical protein VII36_02025 [Usitatibacter sp.]
MDDSIEPIRAESVPADRTRDEPARRFAMAHGLFYVLLGRNLWPLIVVHGVWNTVGMWSTYSS